MLKRVDFQKGLIFYSSPTLCTCAVWKKKRWRLNYCIPSIPHYRMKQSFCPVTKFNFIGSGTMVAVSRFSGISRRFLMTARIPILQVSLSLCKDEWQQNSFMFARNFVLNLNQLRQNAIMNSRTVQRKWRHLRNLNVYWIISLTQISPRIKYCYPI